MQTGSALSGINEAGFAPLHYAVQKGQLSVARFLLDQGANVNTKDREGNTPVTVSRSNGAQTLSHMRQSLVNTYALFAINEEWRNV